MDLINLQKNWEQFGKTDPLWAILTDNSKRHKKWNTSEFFETGKIYISTILSRQDELGITVKRENVLDFGCGVGRLSQALCERYDRVTGIDIAESMVELARKYNMFGNRCTYRVNQRADLSCFPDETFDAVYTFIVLQHIEPRYIEAYLKEFIRVLKPGGLLVFDLPSAREKTFTSSMKRLVLVTYWRIRRVLHIPVMELFYVKKQDISRLIEQNNGKIVSIDDYKVGDYTSSIYWITRKD